MTASDETPASPPEAPPPSGGLGEFARRWGFILFLVLVLVLFRQVLLPFVFAIVVAYILAPVVERLSQARVGQRHLPRGLAVLLCYVATVGALTLFFAAFLPRLSGDLARLGDEGPGLWERVDKEWTPRLAHWLEDHFPSLRPKAVEPAPGLPRPDPFAPPLPDGTIMTLTPMGDGSFAMALAGGGIELERTGDRRFRILPAVVGPPPTLEAQLRGQLRSLLSGMADQADELLRIGRQIVTGIIGGIMKLILALMVAAFLLIDLDKVRGFFRGLVPLRYRRDYDVIAGGIDRGLSAVIRGQLVICLVNGVLTCIGMLIFGVKYAVLLSFVAAALSLIPIFGSILSTVPIVGVALVSGEAGVDVARGLMILVWILGIHFVEANILNPKIMGNAAKMHPVVVIFALIAGEQTFGLVGALFAVPVASIVQTLFLHFRRHGGGVGQGDPGHARSA